MCKTYNKTAHRYHHRHWQATKQTSLIPTTRVNMGEKLPPVHLRTLRLGRRTQLPATKSLGQPGRRWVYHQSNPVKYDVIDCRVSRITVLCYTHRKDKYPTQVTVTRLRDEEYQWVRVRLFHNRPTLWKGTFTVCSEDDREITWFIQVRYGL